MKISWYNITLLLSLVVGGVIGTFFVFYLAYYVALRPCDDLPAAKGQAERNIALLAYIEDGIRTNHNNIYLFDGRRSDGWGKRYVRRWNYYSTGDVSYVNEIGRLSTNEFNCIWDKAMNLGVFDMKDDGPIIEPNCWSITFYERPEGNGGVHRRLKTFIVSDSRLETGHVFKALINDIEMIADVCIKRAEIDRLSRNGVTH